ncbi:MAG: hypothetical protein KIT14_14420 [bacterium]|nr:hypothetical protein [bacterium]
MVRIGCVSSVVAGHEVRIDAMREFLAAQTGSATGTRVRRALAAAGSPTRFSVLPLDELARLGDAGERSELYRRHAIALAERAVAGIVDLDALRPETVSTLVFVSSTGWSAPSIDAHLVRRFGIAPHCRRIPLAQLGCGGGVAALSLAAEIVRRDPTERVLVVSAEVPSLQLQLAEPSYPELLAAAQFGDGAGAAVVSRDEGGCEVLGTRSVLLAEHEEGGRIVPSATGLRLVPSAGLPRVIRSRVRRLVADCARASDVDEAAPAFVIAHPRGAAVLQAVASGLDVERNAMGASWAAWEASGNMVSASVFRALAEVDRTGTAREGDVGMMLAFGTGVACELAAIRWHSPLRVAESQCG